MPISDKILKNLPDKHRAYWTRAQEFISKTNTDWEMAEVGSSEYQAWVTYFKKQGLKPHMLTMVERKVIDKIMVPAKWPEWFDLGYVKPAFAVDDESEWQRTVSSVKLKAMGKAWLDRSDDVAKRLIDSGLEVKSAAPGDQVTYPEFLAHCEANNLSPRPVGAFEPGGYLGPSEVDTAQKRKVYSAEEKAAFLKSAKQTGKEITGMQLSDDARKLLREQQNRQRD